MLGGSMTALTNPLVKPGEVLEDQKFLSLVRVVEGPIADLGQEACAEERQPRVAEVSQQAPPDVVRSPHVEGGAVGVEDAVAAGLARPQGEYALSVEG